MSNLSLLISKKKKKKEKDASSFNLIINNIPKDIYYDLCL